MANEAVILELYGNPPGKGIQYDCAAAVAISKGSFLKLLDAYTVSGGNLTTAPRGFAGIAAADKSAEDGSTKITVYTEGRFDCIAGAGITAGDLVMMSGSNYVAIPSSQAEFLAALSGGRLVGKALESSSEGEVIAVAVGVYM